MLSVVYKHKTKCGSKMTNRSWIHLFYYSLFAFIMTQFISLKKTAAFHNKLFLVKWRNCERSLLPPLDCSWNISKSQGPLHSSLSQLCNLWTIRAPTPLWICAETLSTMFYSRQTYSLNKLKHRKQVWWCNTDMSLHF